MATGKKSPHSPPPHSPKGSTAQRKTTARNAAKPPVINLKATEVKSAKETKAETAATTKQTPPQKTDDKKPASKPAPKPTAKQPESKQPSKKKKGKTGLLLVSLAALVAAGLGGAWAFKEYGQKFFTSPNSANTAQIAALTKQISANDEKLANLQANLDKATKQLSATNTAQSSANNNLSDKIASLESSLAQINTALKQAAKKGTGPADAANTLALEKLTSNLENIDATVKNLKSAASTNNASSSQTTKAITALKAQLETVSQSLATSQATSKSATDKLAQTTKTLSALKLAQTKLQNAPTSSQSGKMASAFTVLRANITSGKPFLVQLDQIATQLPQELSLDKLRPFAQNGAPTNASLLTSLQTLSLGQPTSPDTTEPSEQGGIWNTMTSKLSGLVKVSKVGETDWQGQKNHAIKLLKSGDLKAAITHLKSGDQQPPKALSNWLDLAAKKLDIDTAIGQLSASVMARLTANSQPNSQ